MKKTAAEWRVFWRKRGHAELSALLRHEWNPIGGDVPLNEYESYTTRIASLLASRASANAVAAELARIRHNQLGLPADPSGDEQAATAIAEWFDSA